VSGTPPLLVVGGAHDPSTPQVWARGLARQIAGSRLLLWNGSGHTGYFNDPSVRAREVAYLLSPSSPVPGTRRGRP
jgi:pimeloyl-ACP methyl ester carboxylesterase